MLVHPLKLCKSLQGLFLAIFIIFFSLLIAKSSLAQTSDEFWLAPPEVTQGHAGSTPIYVRLSAGSSPAEVTISMPANVAGFNGGNPIVVNLLANESQTVNMNAFVNILETRPANTVLNTGLKISSTADITAIYEVSPGNNPDIWALKGRNGLGTEFYTPMQNIWRNGSYSPTPYTSFDIVATEDNTTVLIYPTRDLDGGQPAFQSFTVTLNAGQTYSASVTSTVADNNPTGSAVLSDKPIAVSVKDDSVNPSGAGCKDLMGDQLVPVNIVGQQYIVNKGGLTVSDGDNAYVVATANNTKIYRDSVLIATLFAGETFRVQITNALTSIVGSKPFYCIHVTGFGCEVGMALLPPLNCAGSEQVSFVRSTTESFFLNLLVPAGAEGGFVLNGDATLVPASAFSVVPNTGGAWMGARISFGTAAIPDGTANLLTNSIEPFSLGLINGGSSTGCRFGYFSEFSAEIIVDAGPDQIVCANKITQLAGDISGGASQGVWTSNGSGAFSPDEFTLDAIYEPSLADLSSGGVTLKLTSISNCFPVEDEIEIDYTPAPIVDAGAAITACENNTEVTLDGYVDVASGGVWSGGDSLFTPHSGVLNAQYTPSAVEVANGSVKLFLTTTGNGNCFAEIDSVLISFGPEPTADAGPDQTLCANNNVAQLNGSVTIAGGGQWSSPTSGTFLPSNLSNTPTYSPSNSDLLNGSVTITYTTIDNNGCSPVSDQMTLTYNDQPVVDAGSDKTVCKNNADVNLNGTVSNAGGGTWSGGSGSFNPSATALNAVYSPGLADKLNGSVTLTLTSTGNGDCIAVSDEMIIDFTDAPIVDAGTNASYCSNNSDVSLNGVIANANFGIWSTTTGGSFDNTTDLNAVYTPSGTDLTNGSVQLKLTSLDNGTCNAVSDSVSFSFTPSPSVNAGIDRAICSNNPVIQLSGSKTLSGGVIWTGGNGTFDDNTSLNAQYTPHVDEITAGVVELTLTTTANGNCNAVSDEVAFTFTDAPTANAGTDRVVCANNAQVSLTGSVTIASGGTWSNGLGNYAPSPDSLNTVYSPTQSEVNSGSINLILTTKNQGNCSAVKDTVQIAFTPAPTVDAGANQTLCANNASVTLSGTVSSQATGGAWTGGSGTFANASSLNTSYSPGGADLTAGAVKLFLSSTGNGDCNAVTDSLTITFTPAPVANAGADKTVCANNSEVTLNGTVSSAATGGTWTGGSGVFSNANDLGTTYTPSAADISAGSVQLTLTTTGNGLCNSHSDQMILTITPAPTANAGSDQTLCANNAAINLSGVITVATGATWSGGGNIYSPSPDSLNVVYTPSQSEVNSGSINLILTTKNQGNCSAVKDTVQIAFTPAPTVDAGANQTLCANNASVTLSGTVSSQATGGAWTGGSGTFANASSLNTSYSPGGADLTAGSVKLFLSSTGNGDCNAVTDSLTITFTPAPVANAGADKTVCANNSEVTLNGTVSSAATGGTWTGGSGVFSNANDLGTTYTPSAADISAGSVQLTLTTTGNGLCNSHSDQMILTITPAPTANAGSDQTLCANNAAINLSGVITVATGATWSGGGNIYSPSPDSLNVVYTPSQSEVNSGSINLILTTKNQGNCSAVKDTVQIAFTPAPTVDAGANQTLCANNASVTLSGTVSSQATGGAWTGGSGTFANASSLNTSYSPGGADLTAGAVKLFLSSTGNGDCNAVTDSLTITFTPAPVANAGADKTVCANNSEVTLNGTVSSAATGGTWTGGSGVFSNANDLGTTYTPSAADISAGSVQLTLTTTGNGLCNSHSDQMLLTINPEPVVNAGSNLTICSNNPVFNLAGSVANAAGGKWTGGLGLYDAANTQLNAQYTPTVPEISSGSITFTLTSTGNGSCVAVDDEMTVTFSPTPTANAGNDATLCASSPASVLNGSFTVASGAEWIGGNGNFSGGRFNMNSTYTPTASEISAGSVTLTLSTTGNGNCLSVSDDVTLYYDAQPTVNAGPNLVACANNQIVQLAGSFTNASGVEWSGGLGFYNNNDENPTALYTPSNAEIINGSVTLTLTTNGSGACADVDDDVNILINPKPIVSAGADVSVCANNSLVSLDGSVQFASGGQWSGGSGTFSNVNALTGTYQPSSADVSAGFVTLTLTSTGNATCNEVTDQVAITFTPAPLADAGLDITICENNATVQLNGSYTVAEGANWTGGSGSFNPGASTGNATYTPSQSELNNGAVTLTYTTFGNGNCLPASDQVALNFTPAPVVDAGDDYFACVDDLSVPLSGNVSGPTSTGLWSTSGTGLFIPNAGALNGTYQVSSQDSLVGQVTLTLTSTGNGSCTAVADQMQVFISPAGTSNAGPDQMVCSNNPNAALSGTIGGAATSGTWSASGTGIFTPNPNATNVNYIPSEDDLNAGSVTATFAVNSCNQAVDEMTITYTPSPEVAAGNDITACSSDTEVSLSGFVGGASSTGTWTTSGNGTFVPNPNALNATYEFSSDDVTAQVVTLTLAATNIGNCIGVSDQLTLNIFPQGTANAGPDVIACENNPEIQLNGSLTGANQALWSTTGTGTFAPNAQSLSPTYVPSQGDLVNGTVQIVLTAVNSCNNAQDFLAVTFTDAPIVDAGPDQAACGDVVPFQINGSVSNAGGSVWTSTGTGTFQNANNLNTFYVASQDDIDNGGNFLILTSTGNGNCFPVADSLFIDINTGVTVEAGPDRQECVDAGQIQLFGEVSNGSSTGEWSTSGNGVFSPSATALNAVYQFTQTEIDGGSVTLTLTSTDNGICNPVTDQFELTFGNGTFVYAGVDINVCETQSLVPLNGQVSGETNTGVWTTAGDGIFFPSANNLNAQYEPGAADVAAGDVELTLTSTNSTLCDEGASTVTITLQTVPTANAGEDETICGEIESVQLLGSVTGASGGTWASSGSGTFQPDANTLTALYTPSSADSLSGNVTLTLTTTGNAQCSADSDQMDILFSGAVIANAGPNQQICEDEGSVALNGSVEGSSAYQWGSLGSGIFSPTNANLATFYEPSQADINAGSITLYLSAAGSANCPAQTDSLLLTVDKLPVITAEATVEACVTSASVALLANIEFADGLLWSTNGGGVFAPNATSSNVNYTPTAAEIASGQTTVNIAATSNGACGTITQALVIEFQQLAVVNAGTDFVSCSTDGQVALNGSVSGDGYGGQWSTNAFGTFTPDATVLNGSYVFGANDILIGFSKLILTSTNNGPCQAQTDTVLVTINPQATANAGEDRFVCKSTGVVPLNGNTSNAESVIWSTMGDGVFLPSEDVTDSDYIIGNVDGTSGNVILVLTANAFSGCTNASDTIEVTINNPLEADFNFSPACVGTSTQFTDNTEVLAGEIAAWKWTFGAGSISNEANPVFVFPNAGTPTVQLVVTSSIGCNDTISKTLNVVQGPVADFDINFNPAPVNFDIRFTDQSADASAWSWDFGNGTDYSENQNVTVQYPEPGEYIVSLTVTGASGCIDSLASLLTVEGQVTLPPRLPNTFSPNGDELNDIYYVRGGPFLELDFRVFDAWGSQIFQSISQEQGWDGTENGKQSPVGVYVYTIKAVNLEGDEYDFSGRINLLR